MICESNNKLKSLRTRLYLTVVLKIIFLMNSANLPAQPFHIGHTTTTFIDISRENRKIKVDIYYPDEISRINQSQTNRYYLKFPSICFGHGYLMPRNAYKYIYEELVPDGYIVSFPETEGGLFPSHSDLAKDISFVLKQISEYGKDSSSLFFKHVSMRNCAMGHSMGGGSAFLAAQSDSSIRVIATMAPANTKPSAIKAASMLNIPSLIFSGENDCITRPETHHIPIYNSLKSSSKTLITIKGGNHCQMADRNFPCNLAETTCISKKDISRKTQQEIIIRYLLSWLNYQVKGDSASAEQFDKLIETDTSIIVTRSTRLIF